MTHSIVGQLPDTPIQQSDNYTARDCQDKQIVPIAVHTALVLLVIEPKPRHFDQRHNRLLVFGIKPRLLITFPKLQGCQQSTQGSSACPQGNQRSELFRQIPDLTVVESPQHS
jgi:hypothetical protein